MKHLLFISLILLIPLPTFTASTEATDAGSNDKVDEASAYPRFLRWGRWRHHGGNRGNDNEVSSTRTRPQDLIQKLRQHRHEMDRSVDYDYPNGVQTTTGSTTNPEINTWIYNHVQEMKQLVSDGDTIRTWDGLFAELFENADKLSLDCSYQDGDPSNPVVCTHTGDNCYAQALAMAHAKAVSLFISSGRNEMSKDHEYLVDEYAGRLDCDE